MRKISLKNVKSGMVLAKTVYTDDGRVLLNEGVLLREPFISRLHSCKIKEIYVEDEISKGIVVDDVINNQTRMEAKILVKNVMNESKINNRFNFEQVKETVDKIIDELMENPHIIYNLTDIRTVDNYTFSHSVNVCVLSLITAIKLGLTQPELKCIGVGSLLHDVGKIVIDEAILKKPSELNDEEFNEMKKHTLFGYEILNKTGEFEPDSEKIVLEHHERLDGSGYPFGIKGEEIHPFSKIVAIADVYDALTSDRIYRKRIGSHKVIEYLTNPCLNHFDQAVVKSFIKSVAIYPVGTGVLLNTGEKGIVVRISEASPARPLVRIVYNSDGSVKDNYVEVDLNKVSTYTILDTYEL